MSATCSAADTCGHRDDNHIKNMCIECLHVHVLPRFHTETSTHRVGCSCGCDLLLPDELVWHV